MQVTGPVHRMGTSPTKWSDGLFQDTAMVDRRAIQKAGETSPCTLLSQTHGGRKSAGRGGWGTVEGLSHQQGGLETVSRRVGEEAGFALELSYAARH